MLGECVPQDDAPQLWPLGIAKRHDHDEVRLHCNNRARRVCNIMLSVSRVAPCRLRKGKKLLHISNGCVPRLSHGSLHEAEDHDQYNTNATVNWKTWLCVGDGLARLLQKTSW
jgi:hypothetical protein